MYLLPDRREIEKPASGDRMLAASGDLFSFAHAFHCFQLASNSALRFQVTPRDWSPHAPWLAGSVQGPEPAQRLGAGARLIDAADAPLAAEDAVIDVSL